MGSLSQNAELKSLLSSDENIVLLARPLCLCQLSLSSGHAGLAPSPTSFSEAQRTYHHDPYALSKIVPLFLSFFYFLNKRIRFTFTALLRFCNFFFSFPSQWSLNIGFTFLVDIAKIHVCAIQL
jgi:hypothetical protein